MLESPTREMELEKKVKKQDKPPSNTKFIISIISPALILSVIAILFPIITGIYISFTNSGGQNYLGDRLTLVNYYELLFNGGNATQDFWRYTYQTLFFAGISLTLEFGLGLLFAILLNKEFRGRGLARATLLIPWAVPTVASATIFRFEIFASALEFGLINSVLELLGAGPLVFFGADANTLFYMPVLVPYGPIITEIPIKMTMLTVIFIDVWKTTPFITLLILAALQIPSRDLYKAAEIAGASGWQRFRHITWPLILPGVGVAIVFRLMNALRVYDAIVVFNDPSVFSMTYQAVRQWQRTDYGIASATAVILFIIVISLVFYILGKTRGKTETVEEREKAEVGAIYTTEETKKSEMEEKSREIIEEVKSKSEKRVLAGLSERELVWKARKRYIKKFLFIIGVVFLILWCASPFIWIVIRSFRNPYIRQTSFELFPQFVSLGAYEVVLQESEFTGVAFGRALFNSALLSGLTVIVVIIVSSLIAYALAKFDFPKKEALDTYIFSLNSLPPIIIIIPFFIQMIAFSAIFPVRLVNNIFTLILPYAAFNLPLAVFVLRAFFAEIPEDLWKAAKVDGASNFQIFRKIILPLTIPGVFTCAILVFIYSWNELLFAQVFLTSEVNHTVPRAILRFVQNQLSLQAEWNTDIALMAATSIATIPLVIVVLIFQKRIISGLTRGAVKG